METNTDFAQLFIGIHIMQVDVTAVEFAHNIGRKGVITDAIGLFMIRLYPSRK